MRPNSVQRPIAPALRSIIFIAAKRSGAISATYKPEFISPPLRSSGLLGRGHELDQEADLRDGLRELAISHAYHATAQEIMMK